MYVSREDARLLSIPYLLIRRVLQYHQDLTS